METVCILAIIVTDIAGILLEHEKRGNPITLEQIRLACTNLYGSFDRIPRDSVSILEDILASRSLEDLYRQLRTEEKDNMAILIDFNGNHPGEAAGDNVDALLKLLQAKKDEK